MGRDVVFEPERVRKAFAEAPGKSTAARVRATCEALRCSPGTVQRALKGRARSSSPSGPAAMLGKPKRITTLAVGHPATIEKRTLFPTMVFDVTDEWVLKSGDNSGKIGRQIVKGAWAGFPVYTLTLEERATCPTSCRHWASCYGNATPFARRFRPGAGLEWRLEREVAALELENPGGFAVRLHNLGDFYSVAYVELWARATRAARCAARLRFHRAHRLRAR